MGKNVIAFAGGLLFALGLGVSGMTQPTKVIGFLDVFGAWDPTLAFVMMGAMLVYTVMYRLTVARGTPLLGGVLSLPTRRDIDARLVVGATLFGVGWGLGGFCPGPALTSLASGTRATLFFVLAMTAGMFLYKGFDALRASMRQQDMAGTPPGRPAA